MAIPYHGSYTYNYDAEDQPIVANIFTTAFAATLIDSHVYLFVNWRRVGHRSLPMRRRSGSISMGLLVGIHCRR